MLFSPRRLCGAFFINRRAMVDLGLPSWGEFIDSAVGEKWQQVLAALLVGYAVAALIVYFFPSPFNRDRRTGKKAPRTEAEKVAAEIFPDPMPKGDLTIEELQRYDGSNVALPVLIAAKGRVFDVTKGRDFYGKGGPYNCFAGIDCSRALAKVSLDPKDLNANCAELYAAERDVLNDWVRKFEDKYPEVGIVLDGTYDGPP